MATKKKTTGGPPADPEVVAGYVEILAALGDVRARPMFGGHGVFEVDVMFGLVPRTGVLHLKADDEARAEHEAGGGQRYGRMPYWSVPAAVVDDPAQLIAWGRRALTHARATKKPKKKK